MLFSIIVPIFNVEKYINTCFENIYSHGLKDENFEIIAVNDGTTDNSMEYVSEFKKKHNNIVIINKSNGGVSSARNVGIDNAKGTYLIFLDPDDYFSPNSLLEIKNDIEQQDVDFFILHSHKSSNMCEVYRWSTLFNDRCIKSGIEIYKAGYLRGSVCGCVFRRDFIDKYNIRFYENARNCEDTMFFFLCQMHASSIMFLNREFYIVYERENSASRSISKEKLLMMFNNLDYIQQYIVQNHVTDKLQLDMLETLKYILVSNLTYFCIWYNGFKSLRLLKKNKINGYIPIHIKYGAMSHGLNKLYIQLMNSSYTLYYLMRLIKFNKYIKSLVPLKLGRKVQF